VTKEIRISVTAEDINNGVRKDCTACPIALAMVRAGLFHPMARPRTLRWGLNKPVPTPNVAADFMDEFDHGQSVEPFEFTITAEND